MSQEIQNPFEPIYGLDGTINQLKKQNGRIYFATDTGKIYFDINDRRHVMGGAGVTLYYAEQAEVNQDNDEYYLLEKQYLVNNASPKIDDLILNISDGSFYRVEFINNQIYLCTQLAVSGSGGGGLGPVEKDLRLTYNSATIDFNYSYIYGQDYFLEFTGTSTIDSKVNFAVTISQIIKDSVSQEEREVIISQTSYQRSSGEVFQLNAATLPKGNNISITVTLSSPNTEMVRLPSKHFTGISTFDFDLIKPLGDESFKEWVYRTDSINLPYLPSSNGKKQQLMVLIDENPFDLSKDLENSEINGPIVYSSSKTVFIPKQEPGVHIIKLYMTTTVGESSYETKPIIYQVAWVDDTLENPLIWFGDYETSIINYNRVRIPYMIYDPQAQQGQESEIQLYHDNIELKESPIKRKYSPEGWYYWDVTSIYKADKEIPELLNLFTFQCGISSKTISLLVTTVGARSLDLVKPNSLLMNLTSEGRSNSENEIYRTNWSYNYKNNTYNTDFFNFNWYNNGWIEPSIEDKDNNYGAYLSVANGASVKIHVPEIITLNGTSDYAFEFRFRVKNIQEYSTLVKLKPKYFVVGSNESYFVEEIKANGLEYAKDEDGNLKMDPDSPKELSTDKGVVLKYSTNNNIGFGIGTQEAYFKTPGDIISVRYKEDEIINLSFVVSAVTKKLFIYLNGILSGASNLTSLGSSFSIDSGYIEINSDWCDLDLYRARIYKSDDSEFSMADVIHNYLSDERNIDLYDENQLTDISDPTNLLYSKLIEYNENHPDELSMPYAVWEITDNDNQTLDPNESTHSEMDDRLPYYKGNNRWCSITFVNPSLDKAFSDGVITEEEYLAGSPSFYAEGVDINVQGTSSQAYPRRNFKTKFKAAGKNGTWWYTHPKLNNQTLTKWHMDNKDCKTNKFTWKIDYMESSGTYNTGFANLAGNGLYTNHPLQYYFNETEGKQYANYRTTVYGFPCLVFHKHSTPTDKAKPDDQQYLNYEYIGRYNFNLDKSSNEYYGFELEAEQPQIHQPFSKVAECWELRDNQGSWTSFKYPDEDTRATGFATKVEDGTETLEVKKHFHPRYHKDIDDLEVAMDLEAPDSETTYPFDLNSQIEKNKYILNRTINLEKLFNWLDSTDQTNASSASLPEEKWLETTITRYYSIAYFPKIDSITNEAITDSEGNIQTERWFIDKNNKQLMSVSEFLSKNIYPSEDYYITDDEGNNIYIFHSYNDNGCWLDSYDPTKDTNAYIGLVYSYSGIPYTYKIDTPEYRLAKFKAEFNQHLNKQYCLIYFILTELLLCYDSRGKNMMLATWGPTSESNNNYIWFPIFYDIDTQLGLNNIGSVLWDYDTDATKEGTFSTANSVLWTNFYNAFYTDIESTYRQLRSSGILTEEKIDGAYLCQSSVFQNSYAMKGKRPVIALGLDEWYKYIAPGISRSGWTEGTNRRFGFYVQSNEGKQKVTDPQYVYTCQGDRKLSRELFISNRLNYLDSQWLAGPYNSQNSGYKSEIMIRANANDLRTSDKYIEGRPLSSEELNQGYALISSGDFDKISHYNATPWFEITPFLSEYVTVFYDEDPIKPPKKYNKVLPVITNSTSSVEKGYRETAPYNEQLTYIAGGDYLSELGDLSLKYPSHFKLSTGKRLIKLLLGSDYPDYKNGLLGKGNGTLDLGCGEGSMNKKTLLQKIILTGLTEAKYAQDISSCVKLKEYRALNTKIPSTKFAEGCPLETLHLPITTDSLKLVDIKNLNTLLTSKPIVIDPETYKEKPYDSYKGLYIEGLTDYNINSSDNLKNKNFTTLDFKNVALGYGSWIILNNMLSIWDNELDDNSKTKLKINLEDIYWSPYKLVEPDTPYDNSKVELYYQLTNHNTFKPYTYNESSWNLSLLNKQIYIYQDQLNTLSNSLINLNFLDKFIESYENAKNSGTLRLNYFISTDSALDGTFSYPTITGTIFINNNSGNAINELDLQNKYKKYFPYLNITVNHINEANVLKFVQRNLNGSDKEIDVIRFDKSITHPEQLTEKEVIKLNYTFEGWSTESNPENQNYSNIVSQYNEETGKYELKPGINLFSSSVSDVTLYAVFSIKKYPVNFYSGETLIKSYNISYGTTLGNYNIIHENDSKQLINLIDFMDLIAEYRDSSNLDRDKRYNFIGWSKTNQYTLNKASEIDDYIINLKTQTIEHEENYYACYIEDYANQKISNIKFFDINDNGELTPNLVNRPYFKGKITIPKTINGINITSLNNFKNASQITHIFFEKDFKNNLTITEKCFGDSNNTNPSPSLTYFEVPSTLIKIEKEAFRYCKNLVPLNLSKVTSSSLELGEGCFQSIGSNFDTAEKIKKSALSGDFIESEYTEIIPNTIKIGKKSFMNMDYIKDNIILQFGTSQNKIPRNFFKFADSTIISTSNKPFKQNSGKRWKKIIFYTTSDYTDVVADFETLISSGEYSSTQYQVESN